MYNVLCHQHQQECFGFQKVFPTLNTQKSSFHSVSMSKSILPLVYTRKRHERRHERRQKFRVHFLVAKHFIDNDDPETKHEINHKDKNRINNNVSNLEWVSSIENLQHAHNKKVIQCDKDYNLIKIYESSALASKDNNINAKTLSSAIKRKTFTGGFYWKFES